MPTHSYMEMVCFNGGTFIQFVRCSILKLHIVWNLNQKNSTNPNCEAMDQQKVLIGVENLQVNSHFLQSTF